MTYYQRRGDVAPKRSTALRSCEGELRYEELFSSSGFTGPHSFLYRLHPATRVKRLEAVASDPSRGNELAMVTNHLIDVARVGQGVDPLGRVTLVHNEDFSFGLASSPGRDAFSRNAYADELWVVVAGEGTLETEFGTLEYGQLDLIYIPRGTTWRLRSNEAIPQNIVVIEARSPITPPSNYRNASGQFTSRSNFAERDLRMPVFRNPVDEDGEFEILLKLGDHYMRAVLPSHPFDVVGWDGALYPYALNMRDLEPLSGRVWLTPDLHQVFGANGLLISAITPHRTPDHPDRYPAQADHLADCDEIFYRFAIPGAMVPGAGTITVHSRALVHGPKPGFEAHGLPDKTNLWGVIVDVVRPVRLTAAALTAVDEHYLDAWL